MSRDEAELINSSGGSATKPRCLQPQTSTTTGMKNTRSILHSSQTLYKHNESDAEELIFYHNGGFFWAQKCWHKQLPRSRARARAHETAAPHMCAAFRGSDASCCHSATHNLIYAAKETYVLMWHCEHLCGVDSARHCGHFCDFFSCCNDSRIGSEKYTVPVCGLRVNAVFWFGKRCFFSINPSLVKKSWCNKKKHWNFLWL